MRMRSIILTMLCFCSVQAAAGEIAAVRTVNPYNPAQPSIEPSQGLHVYALPSFDVIARNAHIRGHTTVSNDGKRLYELDLNTRHLRTFELPSLQLKGDVPVPPGGIPWMDENRWLGEHPNRPGVLILAGMYWMDTRSGNWVETPTSLRVPAPSYNGSHASISGDGRKLVISYYGSFSSSEPSGVKVVDLDNPRLVDTFPDAYRHAVLMEPFGFVTLDGNRQNILVSDFPTLALQDTIAPPPGLRFRGDFKPLNAHELLHSAWSDASNEQVLLRLNLETKINSELFREQIDDNHPGFETIEVRGERVLLATRTVPPGFMFQPFSTGQLREIDLTNGISTTLLWPVGGGPVGGGAMLATGATQPIPLGAKTLVIVALVLLVLGLQGIQQRSQLRNVCDD